MTAAQAVAARLACAAIPLGLLLVGPSDAVLRRLWRRQPLRTWHWETLVVAAFLAAVVVLSGNDPLEWVGLAALTLAHGRNSVMFRMTEAQQRLTRAAIDASPSVRPDLEHHVECWRWATVYFLTAECFWAAYFILHRAWAALAGVAVFVGYSRWRAWYSRRT